MAKILSPVKGFTGVVASVAFANGEASTSDIRLIKWFQSHGYEVEMTDTDRKKLKDAEDKEKKALSNGSKIKELETENEALRGQVADLSKDESVQKVTVLETQVKELTDENSKLKADKETLEAEIKKLKDTAAKAGGKDA